MFNDFELAEVLWDMAEPCLTNADRSAMCVALHASESFLVIVTAVRALNQRQQRLPRNVFVEFQNWLGALPALKADDPWFPTWLELHLLASGMQPSDEDTDITAYVYGDATLCYFILDEAGVADAPYDRQTDALRRWLAVNRPSPALRADLNANGFGHLL